MLLVLDYFNYAFILLVILYVATLIWQFASEGSTASKLTELIILEIAFCLSLMKVIIQASVSVFESFSFIQVIALAAFIAFRTYRLGKFMGLVEQVSIKFYEAQNNGDIVCENENNDNE